jgi:hypothetical protein
MALPAEVPSDQFETAIPEAKREDYVLNEEAGIYVLDVTEVNGRGLAETAKLLNSSRASRSERDAAVRELAEMKRQFEGVDLNELSQMRTDYEALKAASEGNGAKLEEMRQQMQTQLASERDRIAREFGEQIEQSNSTRDAALAQLDEHLIESAATRAILAKDPQASVPLLMPAIKERVRAVGEAGKRSIEVIDPEKPDSGLMKVVDSAFVPATLEDVVGDLFKDQLYGRAFSAQSGSGSNGNSGAGNGESAKGVEIFKYGSEGYSTAAQVSLKRENPTEYARLRQEAVRLGYLSRV